MSIQSTPALRRERQRTPGCDAGTRTPITPRGGTKRRARVQLVILFRHLASATGVFQTSYLIQRESTDLTDSSTNDPVFLNLVSALVLAPPLAFACSGLLLMLYRRRVAKLMAGDGSAGPTPMAGRRRTLLFASASSPPLEGPQRILRHAFAAPRRAGIAQLLAGGVTGCFIALVIVRTSRSRSCRCDSACSRSSSLGRRFLRRDSARLRSLSVILKMRLQPKC